MGKDLNNHNLYSMIIHTPIAYPEASVYNINSFLTSAIRTTGFCVIASFNLSNASSHSFAQLHFLSFFKSSVSGIVISA